LGHEHRSSTSTASWRGALAALLGAAALALTPAAHAQSISFAPVDEAAGDPAWEAYKTRLLAALEVRNRSALLEAIHPDVDNGPDQTRGLEEFRRRWSLDDEDSPVWRELGKAVGLGGAFVRNARGEPRYCTPYVAARWHTDFDPFRFGAIVAGEVLVKSEPSSGARTIARLAYELVPVEDWEVADVTPGFPQKWTQIRIRDTRGFVPEEQIRSPIEHMACFAAQGSTWRLVSFTAGYLPE
jgi:hypothetical protein